MEICKPLKPFILPYLPSIDKIFFLKSRLSEYFSKTNKLTTLKGLRRKNMSFNCTKLNRSILSPPFWTAQCIHSNYKYILTNSKCLKYWFLKVHWAFLYLFHTKFYRNTALWYNWISHQFNQFWCKYPKVTTRLCIRLATIYSVLRCQV